MIDADPDLSQARDPFTDERRAVLETALARAAGEGWTDAMLAHAGADAGIESARLSILFPEGVRDLLGCYSEGLDQAMVTRLGGLNVAKMRIRERISIGIRVRIEAIGADIDAARRAAALLTLPPYAGLGLTLSYHTVDALWRCIGDRSTDFNFYTKRALAGGVYLSTLAYWFADRSPGKEETWVHLERRIDNVMMIEGAKVQARKLGTLLPSPWQILGRLRYPDPDGESPPGRAPSG